MPKLLDLCCCAGLSSDGYQLAGFEVVGVDILPQRNYPYEFIQADALSLSDGFLRSFDAIHASPPCQFASTMFNPAKPERRVSHLNLIPAFQRLLKRVGKPFVIENVKGARSWLNNPLMLHGSMFGLPLFRDRYFETSFSLLMAPASPRRDFVPVAVNSSSVQKMPSKAEIALAMGVQRKITKAELRQGIPPAYTAFIGRHLLEVVL